MKPHQPAESATRCLPCPVDPGPPLVPNKVVQDSGLHGQDSRQEIVHLQTGCENGKDQQLDADSDDPNGVELQPVAQTAGQRSRSSRYKRMVFRIAEVITIIVSATIATTALTSQSQYCCPKIVTRGFTYSTKVPIASTMRNSVGPQMLNESLKTPTQYVAR